MGILDMLTTPASSFYGGLLNTGDNGPDFTALNPDSIPDGSLAARLKNDPFEDLDKKQKEEAAKKAAAGVFVNGAPAIPSAGVSGQMAMQPGPFGSLAPMAPAAPPQPAPSAIPPPVASAQPAPVPQPRPTVPPSADLPAPVANAQAADVPQPQPQPQQQGPSFLDKVGDKINQNANMMIGLGAGFAGAPSIGTGISRGLTGASAGSQLDLKQNTLGASQSAMYRAFVDAKVPPKLAIAALYDPEIRKSVTENYLSDRKGELKDITLTNGTKMSVLHNPYTNSVTDLQGKPIDLNNIQGGAIDANLTGEAAKAAAEKSDPALLRQAMNYVQGSEMLPSGRSLSNPRLKAAMDLARQIDPELTDNVSQARTSYMKDAGNTKNGVGFQVKGFQQGIEHTHALAKAIEKFAPSDGMGSADLAHAVNSVQQRFGEKSGLARTIQTEGQAAAGEMGKLYSGSSGGGVHERDATAKRFETGDSSATELAGSLEATADLMEGGLHSIEMNRDRVMGDHGSKLPQVQYRNAETEQKIAEIRSIAKRLRGEEAPASAPAATAPAPVTSQAQYDALPSGRTYSAPDGSIRTKK